MPSFTVNGSLIARDHEVISTLTSSTGLTSTKYLKEVTTNSNPDPVGPATSVMRRAVEVLITVEVDDIRWTTDGTTPTTTATTGVGHHAVNGDNITIQGYENITKFRAINETASNGAGLRVTYFFGA